MQSRSRTLRATLAAILLGAAIAAAAADPAGLVDDALGNRGDARALMTAGTEVVPYLLAELTNPDPQRRKNASLFLAAMFSMNPVGMEELRSSPERIPEMVVALNGSLGNPDPEVRKNLKFALMGLILLASPDMFEADILPLMIGSLASPKPEVRAGAAGVLSLVAAQRKVPVGCLLPALLDGNPEVQERVAWTIKEQVAYLQSSGQDCEGCDVAAGFLRQLLKDRERPVAHGAAMALGRIDPEDDEALVVLAEAVGVEFSGRYSLGHALSVLQWMEQQRSRSMVPLLEQLLQSPDTNLRRGAEIALKALRGGG